MSLVSLAREAEIQGVLTYSLSKSSADVVHVCAGMETSIEPYMCQQRGGE